jgi:hypothetical protein
LPGNQSPCCAIGKFRDRHVATQNGQTERGIAVGAAADQTHTVFVLIFSGASGEGRQSTPR